jgi:hypothetical protein
MGGVGGMLGTPGDGWSKKEGGGEYLEDRLRGLAEGERRKLTGPDPGACRVSMVRVGVAGWLDDLEGLGLGWRGG